MQLRPYQRFFRGHLYTGRRHILYRIFHRIWIWPQNWPQRLHFRAPPNIRFWLFRSFNLGSNKNPLVFQAFYPKKVAVCLNLWKFKMICTMVSSLRVFCRHWKPLSRNILHQILTFFLNLKNFVKTFVSSRRHCKQIGCVT